jgi:hypothetical protein
MHMVYIYQIYAGDLPSLVCVTGADGSVIDTGKDLLSVDKSEIRKATTGNFIMRRSTCH